MNIRRKRDSQIKTARKRFIVEFVKIQCFEVSKHATNLHFHILQVKYFLIYYLLNIFARHNSTIASKDI